MNVALCPERLNILSLCTGGGGLDLGLELAMPGARTVCMVEREAFAASHLVSTMQQGLMDETPVWSNARTFNGRPWRGLVDGLIGGIPCQGHSLAGKKRGSLDARDLWSPARRIIVQSRPEFVLIENVEGMLSPGDDDIAGAERVVRDLSRLGFTVEIGLFSASEAGASHQRNRVIIVAVADDAQWRRRAEEFADGRSRAQIKAGGCGRELAYADGAGLERHRGHDERPGECAVGPCSAKLEHAAIDGWREGRPEHEFRGGRDSVAGASLPMAHADGDGPEARRWRGMGSRCEGGRALVEPPSGPLDEPARLRDRAVSVQQGQSRRSGSDVAGASAGERLDLFPPGPADLDRWRRVLENSPDLEPAVRRMADGVAARLDLSGPYAARIERLRLLGNGVVPLQAAYAIRTLCARLAARGSAGAERLVRMMEGETCIT